VIGFAHIAIRPMLARLVALGLLGAVGAGPVFSGLDADIEIEAARARLDRAREQAARQPGVPPLTAADGDALLAAFRARLEALAGTGAVVIDGTLIEPDPARPALPRLRATLRGTAEGLHGLAHAVETGSPLMAVEEADLTVERPADAEIGRPTLMRLAFAARGVVTGKPAQPRRAP